VLTIVIPVLGLVQMDESFAQPAPVPEEYRRLRHALGQENYGRVDSLFRQALRAPEIFPAMFEAVAISFVYRERHDEGVAFFDSLFQAGKFQGEAAGASASIRHFQGKNEESYQYAKLALGKNCRSLWAYELFPTKSYQLKNSASARDFLTLVQKQHPDNWRYRLALAYWHSLNGQLQTANEIAEQLLVQGHTHWRIGNMYGGNLVYLQRYKEALAAYQQALQYCEETRDEDGSIRPLLGVAEAQFTFGKIDEAKQALQQAQTSAKRCGNRAFQPRLNLLQSRLLMNEHEWLAARELLNETREQARKFAEGNAYLSVFYYLANLNRVIGRWEDAMQNTLRACGVADSLGLFAYSAQLLSMIGAVDANAGRYEEALLRLKQLEEASQQQGVHFHREPYLMSLATALIALERYEEAAPAIEEGLQLATASRNLTRLLGFRNHKSAALLHMRQFEQAEALLRETLAGAQKAKQKTIWIEAHVLLSGIYIETGRIAEAQKLLARLIGTLPETPPYNSYLKLMARLAKTHLLQNDIAHALAIYNSTVNVIALQTHMLNPGSLSALTKDEREIFFGLSQAHLHGGDPAAALETTEKAHDLVVRRKQLQAQLLKSANFKASHRREQVSADSALLVLRLRQATEDSPAEALALEGEIRELEQRRKTLLDEMLAGVEVRPLQYDQFDLAAFQRMLREREELAVKFFIGSSRTLAFFIGGDTIMSKELALGHEQLRQLLPRIHRLLTPAHDSTSASYHVKLDTAAAHEAYQTLLHDWLAERKERRLAIVPDDVLHALPFDLLVTARNPVEFLVHRFAIRNGISLSSLQQEARKEWRVQSLVLLADPNLVVAGTRRPPTQRNGSALLPVGRRELQVLKKLVRIEHELVKAGATKEAFFSALDTSDWLHFASHCIGRSREPLFSELILAVPAGQGSPESVYAFEIFQRQLRVKLAILSGCETGRGLFHNGEGFEGFVQAFRAAGTSTVVASLWKVEDHNTSQFFKLYYEELLEHKSTSQALQSAKLKMLGDPRYSVVDWAAFSYYGHDWQVEMPRTRWPNYLIAASMLLVILLGIAVFYLRRRVC